MTNVMECATTTFALLATWFLLAELAHVKAVRTALMVPTAIPPCNANLIVIPHALQAKRVTLGAECALPTATMACSTTQTQACAKSGKWWGICAPTWIASAGSSWVAIMVCVLLFLPSMLWAKSVDVIPPTDFRWMGLALWACTALAQPVNA